MKATMTVLSVITAVATAAVGGIGVALRSPTLLVVAAFLGLLTAATNYTSWYLNRKYYA